MKKFLIKYWSTLSNWPIFIILLLSLLTLMPFLKPGLFPSHDGPVYVLRSQQFYNALGDGQLPPRWAKDFNFQFGYPIFNFFYPLAYYLVAFFHLVGLSFSSAVKLLFLLSFLLSGITMYFFSKEFLGKFGGITAGLLYLYAPFHAVDLYVRGSLGELLVMTFLPLLLLWVCQKRFILAGIILALIVLSHNILALMSFVLLLVFMLLNLFLNKPGKKKLLKNYLIAVFLGLGLSGFFWLPALWEKQYTIFDQIALQEFNFRGHFVYPLQLRYSPWGFGGSLPGPIDGMSFKLGKLHLLLTIMGFLSIFFFKKGKKLKAMTVFFSLLFFGATFLSLNLSYSLWENLPFLELVQFPWRFLNFTMLAMSFLGGGVVFLMEKVFKKKTFYSILFFSILVVFSNLVYFKAGPEEYKNDQQFLGEDKIFATNSTYADELLPIWVKERPKGLPPAKIEVKGEVKEEEFKSNLIKAKIILPEETQVKINNFYFPGWQAFVEGKRQEFEILKPLGNIGFTLQEGEHFLELKLLSTGIQRFANFISVLSLIILSFLFRLREKPRAIPPK